MTSQCLRTDFTYSSDMTGTFRISSIAQTRNRTNFDINKMLWCQLSVFHFRWRRGITKDVCICGKWYRISNLGSTMCLIIQKGFSWSIWFLLLIWHTASVLPFCNLTLWPLTLKLETNNNTFSFGRTEEMTYPAVNQFCAGCRFVTNLQLHLSTAWACCHSDCEPKHRIFLTFTLVASQWLIV